MEYRAEVTAGFNPVAFTAVFTEASAKDAYRTARHWARFYLQSNPNRQGVSWTVWRIQPGIKLYLCTDYILRKHETHERAQIVDRQFFGAPIPVGNFFAIDGAL